MTTAPLPNPARISEHRSATTRLEPVRLSAEALLISSLIHTQDVGSAAGYGVVPSHFLGYADEYNWLINYMSVYGAEPSWDAFKQAFPGFQVSEHTDVRSACDLVFKAFAKRNLNEAMAEAVDLLGTGDVHAAYARITAAEPLRANPKPRELLTDSHFLADWDKPSPVLDTPYPSVNRLTGGMRPGQLWYVAARPGNGKSAHLVNIVKRAVLDGARVKFYSLEMSEDDVRNRFHAALARQYGHRGITLTGLRDRTVKMDEYRRFLGELGERLGAGGGHLDIHTPREGLVTPGVVAAGADEYDLCVVDYVGLMRGDAGTRAVDDWRNLAAISNDLKLIAGSASSTLLVASQINREGEHGSEPPRLANLSGSDALGQDGDVVLTMRAAPHQVASIFSVEKNRHGPSGKFFTKFDPNTGDFAEVSKDDVEELVLSAESER